MKQQVDGNPIAELENLRDSLFSAIQDVDKCLEFLKKDEKIPGKVYDYLCYVLDEIKDASTETLDSLGMDGYVEEDLPPLNKGK